MSMGIRVVSDKGFSSLN